MKKRNALVVISMTCLLLTGCGLKISFSNSSKPIVTSTESKTSKNNVTSEQVNNGGTTEVSGVGSSSEETTTEVASETEKATTEKSSKEPASVTEEQKAEIVSQIGDKNDGADVLDTKFEFTVPDEYVLLEDEYTTNSSRMYALSSKGKIVATIFMNYVDTKDYSEEQVYNAYKEEIEKQYSVISTSEIEQNGFHWNGFFGYKKEDDTKSGYVVFSTTEGATMYLEFMCVDSYECALDVAKVLMSFKSAGGSDTQSKKE